MEWLIYIGMWLMGVVIGVAIGLLILKVAISAAIGRGLNL